MILAENKFVATFEATKETNSQSLIENVDRVKDELEKQLLFITEWKKEEDQRLEDMDGSVSSFLGEDLREVIPTGEGCISG